MSYILDALKKSEHQRQRQAGPDLNALYQAAPEKSPHRSIILLVTCVVFLLINLAGVGYWLSLQSDSMLPINAATEASIPSALPSPSSTSEPVASRIDPEPRQATAQAESLSVTPQVTVTTQTDTVIRPTDLQDRDRLRAKTPSRISDLPVAIQQQIPDLVFSSHLYSDDFRLVNINGRMLREGDEISQGLTLLTITEEGIVVKFKTYEISMSVLNDWSFD